MEVYIDSDLCRATGICQNICPEVFGECLKKQITKIKDQPISKESESACRKAAELCPSGAIFIIESNFL